MTMLVVMILITAFGCQPATPPASPTPPPTSQPQPLQLARATPQPRDIPTREPAATATQPALTPTGQSPTLQATPSLTLPADVILVGHSVEGRTITARRFGSGPRVLLMVGGMHGGWEANTVALIEELTAYFEASPDAILPGMSLVFIPAANPDGMAHGMTEAGRFNANGVDLNRNWGCEWSADAVWRDQSVNAGDSPFSEPETRALAAFIQNLQPATVLFYHSAAAGVYAGECEVDHGSAQMSEILGQATGYSYGQVFTAYRVTGTAASWVDGLGIPAADVELQTQTSSEFDRNLRGIMALQRWIASQ